MILEINDRGDIYHNYLLFVLYFVFYYQCTAGLENLVPCGRPRLGKFPLPQCLQYLGMVSQFINNDEQRIIWVLKICFCRGECLLLKYLYTDKRLAKDWGLKKTIYKDDRKKA